MCEICGCSEGARATVTNLQSGATTEVGASQQQHHAHPHGHHHHHPDPGHGAGRPPDHGQDHGHDHLHGQGLAHAHDHTHGRTVDLRQAVLQKNDELAARNRTWFSGRGILALNLVSSPGAGKTTLLERTIRDLGETHDFAVIEGDQATANDGERIVAAGAPAVQVNTGTGCHLDADMVARGLEELAPGIRSIVMIENVGNLVCPALFDLGERAKVAIVSVTEGEDKPVKYPHMFRASDLVLINKIDLLPHLRFDIAHCIGQIGIVNPRAEVLQISAISGEGLDKWYAWIAAQSRSAQERAFA